MPRTIEAIPDQRSSNKMVGVVSHVTTCAVVGITFEFSNKIGPSFSTNDRDDN